MITTDALRHIIGASGLSMRRVSSAMDRSANYCGSVINQAERMDAAITTDTAALIAGACGYRLALVPADSAMPAGSIVVDPRS